MKKSLFVVVAVLLLSGGALFFWWRRVVPVVSAPAHPADTGSQIASSSSDADQQPVSEAEQSTINALVAKATAFMANRFATSQVESRYRHAYTALERWQALAALRDRRFPRDDAIRLLKEALADPDLGVRVYAAELLYLIGSSAGKDTLLAALRSTAPEDVLEVLRAAVVLNRNREVIPADRLIAVQKLLERPEIIEIMAMQGDPQYAPYVLAAAKKEPLAGSIRALGTLGAPEGYAFADEIFRSTKDVQTKVAAAWAVFRIAGDRDALDYVMSVAAQQVDVPKASKPIDPYAVQDAMRALYVTRDDAVRELLRRTVELSDAQVNRASLASLFYVQQDYGFVDDYIRNYLAAPRAHPGMDPALIGRIVAARQLPQLTALVMQGDPEFAKLFFEPMRGLPAESWIWLYISNLPRR